ncbi:hypothetical protein [Bradyrhizobium sp. MOS003]|uniref:hypothetical protein n=1 Tax=Bradyrhizobium sp. MOS003 TaxID=2133946 RepID=UPI0018F62DB2|nr:hypothetical protein [Bradyrhizobium sp. MOS003]
MIELVLPTELGPGTGTNELIPAPPNSVDPSGIPTRPTVDVEGGKADWVVKPFGQPSDELPESPPPSNRAPDDPGLPDAAQFVVPCNGVIGDTPGVAISVEPSGMPSGRVEPMLSGEVEGIPIDGGIVGSAICAIAATGGSHIRPNARAAPRSMAVNRRCLDLLEEGCSRMGCSGFLHCAGR